MINEQYGHLVEGWLQDTLDPAERDQLSRLLKQGALNQQELDAYRSFSQSLTNYPGPQPSANLRTSFQEMLAAAEADQARPGFWMQLRKWFAECQISMGQLVLAGCMLLLGLAGGYMLRPVAPYENQISRLQEQVFSMQQAMLLSQLEGQSAIQRLKAVNMSQDLPQADQQLIEALFNTLNNDPSINVRLAAIDALRKHTRHARVREGLVRSLSRQDSPLLLIALADELAALQERKAIEPLQKLLKDKNLDRTAEQQLERTLQILI